MMLDISTLTTGYLDVFTQTFVAGPGKGFLLLLPLPLLLALPNRCCGVTC